MSFNSDEMQRRRLLAAIFPSPYERTLVRCALWFWRISDDGNRRWLHWLDIVGDWFDDIATAHYNYRALRGTHERWVKS